MATRFFIPDEGIDISVLEAYVLEFVDRTASIQPSTHPSKQTRTGYLLSSKGLLDREDLEAVVHDSSDWAEEKRDYRAPDRYLDSETWSRRCNLLAKPGRHSSLRDNEPGRSSRRSRPSNLKDPRTRTSQNGTLSRALDPGSRHSQNDRSLSTQDPRIRNSQNDTPLSPQDAFTRNVPINSRPGTDGSHNRRSQTESRSRTLDTHNKEIPPTPDRYRSIPEQTVRPGSGPIRSTSIQDGRSNDATRSSQEATSTVKNIVDRHTRRQAPDDNFRSPSITSTGGQERTVNNLKGPNRAATESPNHRKVNFSQSGGLPGSQARSQAPIAGCDRLQRDLDNLKLSEDSSDARSCDSDSTDTSLGSLFQVSLGDLTVECMVDSASHGNFLSEELLLKMLAIMPEKHRDVKPYWSLRKYVSVLLGSKHLEIVGKISLNPEWHIEGGAPRPRKDIMFKIVEQGQLGHDMIVTWKTAKKSGIQLEDHKKGARCKKRLVATLPSAGLPKRDKEQRKQDAAMKAAKQKEWEKAERERESAAKAERDRKNQR